MNIKNYLENKVLKISIDNYHLIFKEIANELIRNYVIECGNERYRMAEIEFYYYDCVHLNSEWNEKTYPRTDKEAGTLFFHYSGFDICFPSSYKKGIFGGILIRSLWRESDKQYITGPLLCANEILNSCSAFEKWPNIIHSEKWDCTILSCKRFGIEYTNDLHYKDSLCFYDKNIITHNKNRFSNASWDYKSKKPKDIIRNYTRHFKK